MAYVGIVVGHRIFTTGQYCLVKVNKDLVFIRTYAQEAFELACEHLKLPKTECAMLDYTFFGDDVHFVM